MVILGLTGSIGMGKSTAGRMLRRMGIPLHDADAAVHRLLARNGKAVKAIAALFPETASKGGIDRARLGKRVFGNRAALAKLEAILHPLVRAETDRFLAHAARRRTPIVALDIPLLLETGGVRRCDAVLVVTAPSFVQAARVLARPGMTGERLAAIRLRQMPEREKRRRADMVIRTGLARGFTWRKLRQIVRDLRGRRGRAWSLRTRRR